MEYGPLFGICICGLNGSGKTALGKKLADALQFFCMDVEDYYFPDACMPYSSPRPHEDVRKRLLADIQAHPRFVFSAVCGSMGEEIVSRYRLVVYLDTPRDVRTARVWKRTYDQFGDRMLPGGDLYEQEQSFLEFVERRTPDRIEAWLETLSCRVLRLDGREPLDINTERILSYMQELSAPVKERG